MFHFHTTTTTLHTHLLCAESSFSSEQGDAKIHFPDFGLPAKKNVDIFHRLNMKWNINSFPPWNVPFGKPSFHCTRATKIWVDLSLFRFGNEGGGAVTERNKFQTCGNRLAIVEIVTCIENQGARSFSPCTLYAYLFILFVYLFISLHSS